MLCPKCFGEVQVVKNSVYCPNCKIYLAESVDRFLSLHNQKELQEQKASFGKVSGNIQRKLNFEKYKSISFIFLKFFLVIFLFVSFIYKYFFYVDYKNGCFIKIIPSLDQKLSPKRFKGDIKMIKFASPEDYKNVCNFVATINTNTDFICSRLPRGSSCYPGGKTISLSSTTGAYTMIHEVCHAIQRSERRSADEAECDRASLKLARILIEI